MDTDLTTELSCHIEQLPFQVEEPGPVLLHGDRLQPVELLQDLLQPLLHLLGFDGSLGDGVTVEIMIPAVPPLVISELTRMETIDFHLEINRNMWNIL